LLRAYIKICCFYSNLSKWKKRERKEILENQDDVKKGMIWNKLLAAINGSTKIESILGIDY
jgi:hypothetical protein